MHVPDGDSSKGVVDIRSFPCAVLETIRPDPSSTWTLLQNMNAEVLSHITMFLKKLFKTYRHAYNQVPTVSNIWSFTNMHRKLCIKKTIYSWLGCRQKKENKMAWNKTLLISIKFPGTWRVPSPVLFCSSSTLEIKGKQVRFLFLWNNFNTTMNFQGHLSAHCKNIAYPVFCIAWDTSISPTKRYLMGKKKLELKPEKMMQ